MKCILTDLSYLHYYMHSIMSEVLTGRGAYGPVEVDILKKIYRLLEIT